MSLTFSIAEQSVTLPDGNTLTFSVDPSDSSLVSIEASGAPGVAAAVCTFKRNGDLLSTETITLQPNLTAPITPDNYPSVDKDAVRSDPDADQSAILGLVSGSSKSKVNTTASLKAQSEKDKTQDKFPAGELP